MKKRMGLKKNSWVVIGMIMVALFLGCSGGGGSGSKENTPIPAPEPPVPDPTTPDTTPDAFSFLNQTGLAPNDYAYSNTVLIYGINRPTPVEITGGSYAINGGSFQTDPQTVEHGDRIMVRLLSGSLEGEEKSATLFVGGVSADFTATVKKSDPPYHYFSADDGIHGRELWRTTGEERFTEMVADINTRPKGAYPKEFTFFNTKFVFTAQNSEYGRELWVTSQYAPPVLYHDTLEGQHSGDPQKLTVVTDGFREKLFFFAKDKEESFHLWVMDPRQENPVYAIPGTVNPYYQSNDEAVAMGGRLYFVRYHPTYGRELWVSRGTESGTYCLRNIAPGAESSNPARLTAVENRLFFTIHYQNTSPIQTELWVADGSIGGTRRVLAVDNIDQMVAVGNRLFFTTSQYGRGDHLWVSDGTTAGTHRVKGFDHPDQRVQIIDPIAFGTDLYYSADDGIHGKELWRSDGSLEGTVMVRDIHPGENSSAPEHFIILNQMLYFSASDGLGRGIWKSDGTEIGTERVKGNIVPEGYVIEDLIAAETLIFFSAEGEEDRQNLWRSDGTESGTFMVNDLPDAPFIPSAKKERSFLKGFEDEIIFAGENAINGVEVFTSDGTAAGTTCLLDIAPANESGLSHKNEIVTTEGGITYFVVDDSIDGQKLWVAKSDVQGNPSVTNIHPDAISGEVNNLTLIGETLYFLIKGPYLRRFYKSDGTKEGTVYIKTIARRPSSLDFPVNFTAMGGVLYFVATDDVNNRALWRSDGTPDGTYKVFAMPEGEIMYRLNHFSPFKGALYFTADTSSYGNEIWKSDGTFKGTHMLLDIWPGGNSAFPAKLTPTKDALFFSANSPTYDNELWKTSGTSESTVLVKDINPDGNSYPDDFAVLGDHLYFSAVTFNPAPLNMLWTSDGTREGTRVAQNINQGRGNPSNLTVSGNRLFFIADGGNGNGRELWANSDFGGFNTRLLKDIRPGFESSKISDIIPFKDMILFKADDGTHGQELWVSDGSQLGTHLVKDIREGETSAFFEE